MKQWLLAGILLLAPSFAPAASAAECTELGSPPIVMTAGGRYCLGGNVSINSTAGNPIRIDGNNIELDCRGYSIVNANANSSGTTNAIYVSGRRNVRIHDCHVTGGFAAGIYVYQDNGLANQNRDIEISGNSVSGAYWYGILAYGTNITVAGNRVSDIGGRDSFAMGIRIGASNLSGESRHFVVTGNDVSDVVSKTNNGYAIYANNPDGSLIARNTVYGPRGNAPSYQGYGVYVPAGINNRIVDNTLVGSEAAGDAGIVASGLNTCYHNEIRGMGSPLVDCDASNGNY